MDTNEASIIEAPSPRTRLKRRAARGRYTNDEVQAILADGLVCHVAVVIDGYPTIIPFVYAVVDGELCLHGSVANRILRAMRDGAEACVTVTHLDGLVLGRSAFRHSVNYRSVVIYGRARELADPEEKKRAMAALIDHVVPGRNARVRPPSREELLQTMVLLLPLGEASAKVRSGPPVDDEADLALDVWAGVIPLRTSAGAAVSDPQSSIPVSEDVLQKVERLA